MKPLVELVKGVRKPHRSSHPENCSEIQVLQHKGMLGMSHGQRHEEISVILKGIMWNLNKWTLNYPCLAINSLYEGLKHVHGGDSRKFSFPIKRSGTYHALTDVNEADYVSIITQ